MKFKDLFKTNDNTGYEIRINPDKFASDGNRILLMKCRNQYDPTILIANEYFSKSTYRRYNDLCNDSDIVLTLEDDYAWYLKTPRYLINFR